jgi:hypothetical protein
MDKYDMLVEAFGLERLIAEIDPSRVLEVLHSEGLFDPDDYEYTDIEEGYDE